jgi:RNA polymerase sigma-70 factor, ECF subfamily
MMNEQLETRFKAWVQEHGGIVFKVAHAYTLTPEEAEDLAQEILLQLWRSMPRFEGRAAASTWIYRVALNTALGWQRKERRRRDRQRPVISIEDTPAAVDDAGRLHQREMVERLYVAIRLLPKADAALVLLYLDDLSYSEMAEVLGISESNVGVKLNRARKALGELMKEVVCGS